MKTVILKLALIGAAIVVISASGIFTQTAFADIDDACGSQPTQAEKIACEDGYNGDDCAAKYSGNIQDVDKKLASCNDGAAQAKTDGVTTPPAGGSTTGGAGNCGGAKTEIVNCDEEAGLGAIASLIKIAILVVTVLVGIVAVGGITYAAILYASARDNQSQVQEAVTMIRNVIIGLVMYGFSIAIINWLIPGGVIG